MKWELNTVQNADVNCSTKLLLNTVKSQPFATGWLFWSLAYKKCLLKNFVSILSSKVSVEQAQRVSLSTPGLMSVLFTYHNLTILLKASNSILDEIAHAILLQLIHI